MPWIEYENKGDISGRYPVYVHYFEDFVRHPDKRSPPRAFLYFYLNEIPAYPEKECRERGCWIISNYLLFLTSLPPAPCRRRRSAKQAGEQSSINSFRKSNYAKNELGGVCCLTFEIFYQIFFEGIFLFIPLYCLTASIMDAAAVIHLTILHLFFVMFLCQNTYLHTLIESCIVFP